MRKALLHLPDGSAIPAVPPAALALLPGSFHPLHAGHRTLAAVVERKFGRPVHFELSRTNVDKPELPGEVWKERAAQFRGYAPLWVTRAAVFEEKSVLFPGALFVVGFDTAVRLLDAKYYADETARDASLRAILQRGCRFAVGGRADASGVFRTWNDIHVSLSAEWRPLFETLTEEDFRLDISSTELRKPRGAPTASIPAPDSTG